MNATRTIGPYSRPHTLAKLDRRTREARLMQPTRAALVAHVGGRPTAVQAALIEQAVQLHLRIAAIDRKFTETGQQTDRDSRTYLAWANTYGRLLARLGLAATPAASRDLRTILADRAAGR